MTLPDATAPALALGSASASATSSTVSSRVSSPVFSSAETSTNSNVPPHEVGMTSWVDSSCRTRSGLALGLSILLIATMNGTSAARAWSIASIVVSMTPSSAATTMTATSVILAPRARMAVNASWPGVSRNVSSRPWWRTW